jgi:hypothetical protein
MPWAHKSTCTMLTRSAECAGTTSSLALECEAWYEPNRLRWGHKCFQHGPQLATCKMPTWLPQEGAGEEGGP